MKSVCMNCEKPLTYDEIGIYKKLINRGAEEFLCLCCLSRRLNVTEEQLKDKIELFRKQGCTLFI